MPTPQSIKDIPTKALPRIAEFFAKYKSANPEDQPWVEAQLDLVEAEMLKRPHDPEPLVLE